MLTMEAIIASSQHITILAGPEHAVPELLVCRKSIETRCVATLSSSKKHLVFRQPREKHEWSPVSVDQSAGPLRPTGKSSRNLGTTTWAVPQSCLPRSSIEHRNRFCSLDRADMLVRSVRLFVKRAQISRGLKHVPRPVKCTHCLALLTRGASRL
ncbi:uncharacterized protein B0I36DRAFT_327396 [Microdochium trichocladiopsis]|uniref:Uncharacterized protein n=1 Tax=Microdochium trichocladiopsis TaxID=1682393 RepID=A0A9P8Y4Q0_9PEZI|nr:uncharacterized protein B0I36DRAFT_327396 [Microdochium trichocladiopsis]KAH7027575.1 hypothetical protein B0I36DRAFT_327396 [Microdochium trichocladiopsis]